MSATFKCIGNSDSSVFEIIGSGHPQTEQRAIRYNGSGELSIYGHEVTNYTSGQNNTDATAEGGQIELAMPSGYSNKTVIDTYDNQMRIWNGSSILLLKRSDNAMYFKGVRIYPQS